MAWPCAGLAIRSARTVTLGDAAVSLWEVSRSDIDAARLTDRLRPAMAGELDLSGRLELTSIADAPDARVRLLDRLSETATLVEVRAQDRRGLVWTVCDQIASLGLSIRSAHMSTYGDEVRDVFYVVDGDGQPLDDPDRGDPARRPRHRPHLTCPWSGDLVALPGLGEPTGPPPRTG